jgi:hypothetical protein
MSYREDLAKIDENCYNRRNSMIQTGGLVMIAEIVSSVNSTGSFLMQAGPRKSPVSSEVLRDLSNVMPPLDRGAGSVAQDEEKLREQMIRELFKKKENNAMKLPDPYEFSRSISENELRKDIDNVSKVVTDGKLRSDIDDVTRVRKEKLSTGEIEWRESTYPGLDIAGVYNPDTHKVEWRRDSYQHYPLCGVYNPSIRQIEWRVSTYQDQDIAGVYNPDTHKVEWRYFSYQGYSLGGVFNERSREIEWRIHNSRDYDMAGVYNPDAGAVEWQKCSYPNVRLAGVYCPSENSPSPGENIQDAQVEKGTVAGIDEWIIIGGVRLPVNEMK